MAEFPRLANESAGQGGVIRWSVRGDIDKLGHAQLHLAVTGTVHLTCQRCLKPYEFGVDSESVLLLAQDEATAEQIEGQVDEEFDVIVAPQPCNLAELIEDEALLAIPLSPRHETCPGQAVAKDSEESRAGGKPSPFAVLKNWKQ